MPDLTAALVALGASAEEAGTIAARQAEGDLRPLLRHLFLHLLWSEVHPEEPGATDPPRWIGEWESGLPMVDVAALRRLIGAGVDTQDLSDVVRSAQVLLVYNIANMLDDGWGFIRLLLGNELTGDLHWELVASEASTAPGSRTIEGLHECLGDQDPTGRGCDPRAAPPE
jgi:hypothetical protein